MSAGTEASTSQRIVAYDALRVFAIVSVVAIHTLMPYRELLPDTSAVRVFDDLLHYAVPLFVFISGLFVWGRPLPSGQFRTFLARRASVIALPFVAWSVFYLALLMLIGPRPESVAEAAGLFVTGHIWYHLYFIPMLLTYYLLTPIATRIVGVSPELLLVGTYLLRIVAGPALAEGMRSLTGDLGWAYATHVLTHLPHMALGAWFAVRQPKIARGWIGVLLLGLGTAILTSASLGLTSDLPIYLRRLVFPAGMAATVLGFVAVALLLEPMLERHEPVIVRGAALAFGVYFVHPLFLLGISRALVALSAEDLWLQAWLPVTVFTAVTAASYGIAELAARTPGASRLVGFSRPLPPVRANDAG